MAGSRVFWRFCFGWCLLLCVLSSVEAATKTVNVPSIADQVAKGTPSLADSVLTMNTAIEGEFIPAATKNVPVRGIIGGTEFGLNTIKTATRGLLRGTVPTIVAGLALDQLLKGLDWVEKDGQVVKKAPSDTAAPTTGTDYYQWTAASGSASSAEEGCFSLLDSSGALAAWGDRAAKRMTGFSDPAHANCEGYVVKDGTFLIGLTSVRYGSGCPANSEYSATRGACYGSTYVPLSDTDFIDMDTWINNQDSAFVRDLLKQSCVGSNNPNGCYESLRKRQLDLRGPSSVDAGSTTTTSTHANSDGTTSTTVTTTNNKYNMTYSPTTMTYTSHSTTVSSTDGKPGDSTSTDENPSDEADPDPDSDDDTTPSPCAGTGCDGPAYVKLYEPTKDTKEQYLDSYASRVKALPIISSASGFFTVSASAGCPSWSTNVNFDVLGASFSYDLLFDFYCQSWFVSMAAYAKAVFSIVCAYLAFRQAILD